MPRPDRETLAAAVDAALAPLWTEREKPCEHGDGGLPCNSCAIDAAVDAVLDLLPPSPSEGEADEAAGRVAAFLERRDGSSFRHDAIELLTDGLSMHTLDAADLRLLLADRERWRERAFRAARMAMELEEGSEVQWAVEWPEGSQSSVIATEELARRSVKPNYRKPADGIIIRREVGPWKPAPDQPK